MTATLEPVEIQRHLARLGRTGAEEMLRRILRVRLFEEAVEQLAKRNEIRGSVHLSTGQEATSVGVCMAVEPGDRVTGSHRSHGHPIAKGAGLDRLMAELFGRTTGVCRGKGGSMHLADFSAGSLGESAIVGASIPVAVGSGLASVLRRTGAVTVAFFGDGAANAGVCHEAMNLAAVWKLPVVFVCENNSYAGTTANTQVSAQPRISGRAAAYDMPGRTVDGQDAVAVYAAAVEAVRRARAGEGPSLIEALTYMYGGHAVNFGDALGGRRPAGEKEHWLSRDPVQLFANTLREHDVMTPEEIDALRSEVENEVHAAVEFARASPPVEPSQLWADMYVDDSVFAQPEQPLSPIR